MIQWDEIFGVVLGFLFILLLQADPEKERLAALGEVVALCSLTQVLCSV